MQEHTNVVRRSSKLASQSWDLHQTRPSERFDLWQRAINASHYTCRLDDKTPANFNAGITATAISDIRLVKCSCDPCRGGRSGNEITLDRKNFFGLLLIEQGCNEIVIDSRTSRVEPGMALLWDSSAPIRFRLLSPIRKHTVFLEQDRLLRAFPNAHDRLGTVLDWRYGIGALASSHIRALSDQANHIDAVRGPATAEMLLHLISAALEGTGTEERPSAANTCLLARADAHVAAHLDNPELGPLSIAEALGISVRTLHKLYAQRNTTVSRRILERRLERCRSDLIIDPNASITEIAFRWGFKDTAHFSHAFRRQYSETARAYRNKHQAIRT